MVQSDMASGHAGWTLLTGTETDEQSSMGNIKGIVLCIKLCMWKPVALVQMSSDIKLIIMSIRNITK